MTILNFFSSHPYQISFENVSWLNNYSGNQDRLSTDPNPRTHFKGVLNLIVFTIYDCIYTTVFTEKFETIWVLFCMGFLPKCRLYTFFFLKIHFIVLNTVEGRPPNTKLGARCVVWVNCVPVEYSTVNIGVWLMTWVVRLLIYLAYFSSDYEKRKGKAVGCERNDFWNAVWCRFFVMVPKFVPLKSAFDLHMQLFGWAMETSYEDYLH